MSNFSCIGLPVHDQASYRAMVEKLIDLAADDGPEGPAARHLRWKDPSGASVAFHLAQRAIECVTPFFDPPGGLATWRARTVAPTPDPDCVHCSGADCDLLDARGQLTTRACVQWLHFLPQREWLQAPQTFDLEVAAFAQAASFFATPEAYREGQASYWARPDGTQPTMPDGKPMRLADVSFMPQGLFAKDLGSVAERARVTFSGRVERSERLRNSVTGAPFHWVRVRTVPGLLDTVFDPTESAGDPSVGAIAFVQAWLVGRPRFS
jgi:hypothetical protein